MTILSQLLIKEQGKHIPYGTRDRELLEKVLTTLPIEVRVVRDSKRDYHNECGLGYRVTLKNTKTGFKFNTGYNNSRAAGSKAPDINDILYCLVSDRSCYLSSGDSYEEFCSEFGYEPYITSNYSGNIIRNRQAYQAFTGCRNIKENLEILLTAEELEQLEEFYQDF